MNIGEQTEGGEGVSINDFNDGTVLYIDPNDPQAAALLQQAGLTITEDGTVIGGIDENQVQQADEQGEVITPEQVVTSAESQLGSLMEATDNASAGVPQELFMSTDDMDTKENLQLESVAVSAGAVISADSQPLEIASALQVRYHPAFILQNHQYFFFSGAARSASIKHRNGDNTVCYGGQNDTGTNSDNDSIAGSYEESGHQCCFP